MSNTKRRILMGIAALSLCICLAGVGYAFGYRLYQVKDNYFHTGTVDVEIAYEPPAPGQVTLFTPGVLYEPGMTVRGDFTVTNLSTDEAGIWCRIYFSQVSGPLSQVMEARLYDGGKLLCSGNIRDWTDRLYMTQPLALDHGAAKTLTLELHYPENQGNDTQGQAMQFALSVTAVQRSSNPDGQFD